MPPQRPARVVPTRSGVQYTPEQWAEKRAIITQLYAKEGKSLRDVKEFLRMHHDFRPTDRMYQRKIAQWGLDKKHKAPEMRAILRLAKQRQAAGQESVFRVRGRRVDIEEVYRYFKRKGEDPTRLDIRDGSPIPATVTVETPSSSQPPPPPPPRLPQSQSFHSIEGNVPMEYFFAVPPYSNANVYASSEFDFESASAPGSSSGSSTGSESVESTPLVFSGGTLAVQVIPNYPHLAMPIDPTFDLQCSRILLCWTQCFFDAIVPKEFYLQSTTKMKPWRRTLSSWSQATSEGHELLQRGQADNTAELRERAHENVKKHITHRSPITILRYFEIINTLDTSKDPRDRLYLNATLKYVLEMADFVLFPGHPIRELTRLLLHPRASQIRGLLAQQGVQRSLDVLFERCGPWHPRILYAFDTQTQTSLDQQQYQRAINEANRYRERAEFIRGDHSYEICQALRMLGDAYAAQGQHDKAIAEYEKAFDRQRHMPEAQDRGIIGVKTKRGLAAIAKSRGQFSAAVQHLLVAKQMAIDAFGDGHVQVKLVQADLNDVRSRLDQAERDALQEQNRQRRGELPYRPLNA